MVNRLTIIVVLGSPFFLPTEAPAQKLYWRDDDAIRRANLDGSDVETVLELQVKYLALDVLAEKMFFMYDQRLRRADFDGSNIEEILAIESLDELVLDPVRQTMYWISSVDEVRSANFDGSQNENPLALADVDDINGISIDVVSNKLYFTGQECFGSSGLPCESLFRSDLDGSNLEKLITQTHEDPFAIINDTALVLDLANGYVFRLHTDGQATTRRARLNGTADGDILSTPERVVVDSAAGHIFWIDGEPARIRRADLDGSNVIDILLLSPDSNSGGLALAIDPPDCNGNGVPDVLDVVNGTSSDCTGNGIPDECEPDCNDNGVADSCDIANGTSMDCNDSGFGVPDECEIALGLSQDCDSNGTPDECETDCNGNGIHDDCDIASATSADCNTNGIPDECDTIPFSPSSARDRDRCEDAELVCPGFVYTGTTHFGTLDGSLFTACGFVNHDVWYRYRPARNGITTVSVCAEQDPDEPTGPLRVVSITDGCSDVEASELGCTITPLGCGEGSQVSWNVTAGQTYYIRIGVTTTLQGGQFEMTLSGPECLLEGSDVFDCNLNGVPDDCDIASGVSEDCTANGLPDECERDCNANAIPDSCEAADPSLDVNANAVPDDCDISVTWRAVSLNGSPINPTDDVTVLPGDQVVTELFIEGSFGETLRSYVVAIDPAGYVSGSNGSLVPNLDPDPNAGLFVDTERPDWLFAGSSAPDVSCGTVIETLFGWCSVGDTTTQCVSANGKPRYLATLILNVAMDASGSFQLEMSRSGLVTLVTTCQQIVIDDLLVLRSMAVNVDCNANGIPDVQDVAAGAADCNENAAPDECERDCDGNAIPDTCDLRDGMLADLNGNNIPDACEIPAMSSNGSRYLQITPHELPRYEERIALSISTPDPECVTAYVQADGTLGDEPVFQLPESWGTVNVHGPEVVPDTTYEVQVEFVDGSLSTTVSSATSRWGDAVGLFVSGAWEPADGAVHIIDALACLARFASAPTAPPLQWCDLEPQAVDAAINISDILRIISAFQGLAYPFDAPCS